MANSVSLYPNPASDVLTMQINRGTEDELTIDVVSPTGSIVATQHAVVAAGRNTITTSLAHLPAGVYIVKVTDLNGRHLYHGKVTKQ